jgi:hypothetical protein
MKLFYMATVTGVDSTSADVQCSVNPNSVRVGDIVCSAFILTADAAAVSRGWQAGTEVTPSYAPTVIEVDSAGDPLVTQKQNTPSGNLTGTQIIVLFQNGSFQPSGSFKTI